jgi:hypothetical protein
MPGLTNGSNNGRIRQRVVSSCDRERRNGAHFGHLHPSERIDIPRRPIDHHLHGDGCTSANRHVHVRGYR